MRHFSWIKSESTWTTSPFSSKCYFLESTTYGHFPCKFLSPRDLRGLLTGRTRPHGHWPSLSSVLLQPTGRKTDFNKLGQPESRRFAERTRKGAANTRNSEGLHRGRGGELPRSLDVVFRFFLHLHLHQNHMSGDSVATFLITSDNMSRFLSCSYRYYPDSHSWKLGSQRCPRFLWIEITRNLVSATV